MANRFILNCEPQFEYFMIDHHFSSILQIKNVSLQATNGSGFLLQDITFEVLLGQKIGVVGASGAGKTSLLRLLNRLAEPTQGEIYFRNSPSASLSSVTLRNQIVLVPQEPKLLGMKVIDALSYPLQLQQLSQSEINQRIETWSNLLHLSNQWLNKTELQLSLGQRQLVAIARALMMQPQILLLDEPTSALDIGSTTYLLEVLHDLSLSQNLTIIMVNHQLDLIQNFCDRILYINAGNLIKDCLSTSSNWQAIQKQIVQQTKQQQEEWD